MNMKRKMLSLVLVLALVMGICPAAFATESAPLQETAQTFNEYDSLQRLQASTDEELAQMNLTREEVNATATQLEESLQARARLSDEELAAIDYTQEEIQLLRAYASGARLSTAELRAVTGTCTGNIVLYSCNSNSAFFYYTWTWDKEPAVTFQDAAAVRWLAYNSSGYEFSITRTSLSATIDYYYDGVKQVTVQGTEQPSLDFNTTNIQFKVLKQVYVQGAYPTGDVMAYAKTGKIIVNLRVDSSVENKINYIDVAGLYGHTILGATFPSVGISTSGGLSISFSGNAIIDHIAGKKVRLRPGNRIEILSKASGRSAVL